MIEYEREFARLSGQLVATEPTEQVVLEREHQLMRRYVDKPSLSDLMRKYYVDKLSLSELIQDRTNNNRAVKWQGLSCWLYLDTGQCDKRATVADTTRTLHG